MTEKVLELEFQFERETKRTRRFAEVDDGTFELAVGTLYVQKAALAGLGNPERLRVRIEPAPKGEPAPSMVRRRPQVAGPPPRRPPGVTA